MDEEKSFEERVAEDEAKRATEQAESDALLAPLRAMTADDLKKTDKDLRKQMEALNDQRLLIAHVLQEKEVE